MEAAPASRDLELLAFVRDGKRKARVPFERCGDAAAVFKMYGQLVLVDLRIHNAGR